MPSPPAPIPIPIPIPILAASKAGGEIPTSPGRSTPVGQPRINFSGFTFRFDFCVCPTVGRKELVDSSLRRPFQVGSFAPRSRSPGAGDGGILRCVVDHHLVPSEPREENSTTGPSCEEETELFRYRMVVSYDGTPFAGFQIQPSENTVQKEMEDAIGRITGMSRREMGLGAAGRTDAGVHALGQVIHFNSIKEIKPASLQTSLNAVLPPTIRILSLSRTSPSFHARFCAIRKTYHYVVCNTNVILPFSRLYKLHVPFELDTARISDAAQCFVGIHDFSAFANSSLVKERDAVREIYRFDLVKVDDGFRFEVEGSGFLYKQVRNMVGILLQVGKRLLTIHEVQQLLESKDRVKVAKVAPSAPPHGLFLVSVEYPNEFSAMVHTYEQDNVRT